MHTESLPFLKQVDDALSVLQTAFAENKIDELELESKTAELIKAKTPGEVKSIVGSITQTVYVSRLKNYAIFSGIEQKMEFVFPQKYEIVALFGGCSIDLSKAKFVHEESVLEIKCIFSGIEIFVPNNVKVEINSTPVFSGISNKTKSIGAVSNNFLLKINTLAVFGGIEIKTKHTF